MEPGNTVLSLFEALPEDLFRIIVAKIAASSPTDFCNARLACKSFNFDLNDKVIAKELKLTPLVKSPMKAKPYNTLINSCLKAGNVDAHFIEGVLQFFNCRNTYLGLHHLEVAAGGGQAEGSYLFGVLMMYFGRIDKGRKVINRLVDEKGITVLEDCWESIQIALSNVNLKMKKVYIKSYEEMQPELHCHPGEADTVCSKCFHFHLVSEFFELVMGLNSTVQQ